jgi:hypothetical protein
MIPYSYWKLGISACCTLNICGKEVGEHLIIAIFIWKFGGKLIKDTPNIMDSDKG